MEEAPDNNLGPYLAKRLKGQREDSTDIAKATGIHVESIRKMRNGIAKSLPAVESHKIALFVRNPIEVNLKEVYPNLKDPKLPDLLSQWQFHYNWFRAHSFLSGKTPI